MAERVVLHVGLLKTGTSYLQERLKAGRSTLEEHGVWYPRWRDQVDGVIDVLGIGRRPRPEDAVGAWSQLVDQIRARSGEVVLSMEFLGPARPPQIARVVESLAGIPVHVVITARDLNRVLLAMWQETAKNGGVEPWSSFLAGVRENSGAGTRFWRQQRLAVIVRSWAEAVGIEHVTVVTVPPPGGPTETLWNRFCEACGLDPALAAPVKPANESLGAASAEVLRRVNAQIDAAQMPWPAYSKAVKFGFAKSVLAARRDDEAPLGMPVPPWLEARAASMRRNVEGTGVRIIGTLDDLTPVAVDGVTPDQLGGDQLLEAALGALADVMRREAARDDGRAGKNKGRADRGGVDSSGSPW